MAKFSKLGEEPDSFDYGNVFFRQPVGPVERLVIGPTGDHVALLCDLATRFRGTSYRVLYVLLVSHAGHRPGRYASPPFESYDDLELFLRTFQSFFEGDGRHHLWIGSAESKDLLVYDQHDVVFAYGSLDVFEEAVTARGFSHREFWFPTPHAHAYPASNATVEDELMAFTDWQWHPLEEGDEWD